MKYFTICGWVVDEGISHQDLLLELNVCIKISLKSPKIFLKKMSLKGPRTLQCFLSMFILTSRKCFEWLEAFGLLDIIISAEYQTSNILKVKKTNYQMVFVDTKRLVMIEILIWFIGCVTNICWAAARFYWLEESPFTEIKEIQLTISKKYNLQYIGNTIDKIWEIQLTISEKYNNSIREKQSTISEKYNDNIW